MSASEVVRLREQIERECEASWQALYGLAAGNAQHEFITARLQHMDVCHRSLGKLIGGEQATALVYEIFERVGEAYTPVPESSQPSVARPYGVRSTAQAAFRKIVLIQEEK